LKSLHAALKKGPLGDKDLKELYDVGKRLADLALLSAPTNRKIINDHARALREAQDELQELQKRKEEGKGDVKALETEIAATGKALEGLTASLVADGKPVPLSDKLYSGDGEEVKLPAKEGDKKAGRKLFIEKGCMACHVHQGTTKAADGPTVPGEATFAPD